MQKKCIGKYLSIARRAHSTLLDQKLKPYDISHAQIMLLMALYKKEGIYQQNLSQMYNLNKAAVGREIQKLSENGFIIKKPDPKDKRKKLIYLTKKAKDFKTKLLNILDTVEQQLRENITGEEMETFIKVLEKICDNLNVNLKEKHCIENKEELNEHNE